jgi:predicted P-loop ATPase
MVTYKDVKPAVLVKTCLDIIHEPGELFEVRIPKTKAGTISGYFNDTSKASIAIAGLNGKQQAIYATVNPIKSALLARNENKLEFGAPVTTNDAEIEKRRWFLLDFDPKRPTGISSTDGELEAAKDCADGVVEWLTSIGWPQPLIALSGNGVHVMYRCDEPNDEPARVDFECATKMLSSIFTTPTVEVDITSFNASRVWKVYGTLSMKGSSTADRPHRIAEIIGLPSEWVLVTRDQISNVAAPIRDAKSDEFKDMTGEYITDIVKWLTDRGQTVVSGPRPMFGNDGQKWIISRCPFNPAHKEPMVGLVNNRPVFKCLHNTCSAFKWKDFREKIDPSYKDPSTVRARLKEWCEGTANKIDKELAESACELRNKLAPMLKSLMKEVPRARVYELEELLKVVKRERQAFAAGGENREKGNIVGLISRTRGFQADGSVPMYWTSEYDGRPRVGQLGEIDAPYAEELHEIELKMIYHAAGDVWVSKAHTHEVIIALAADHLINPLKVYFKRMKWDGTKRLDTWLIDYLGTKDTEYTRAVGRKWLISAVARAMQPGCQADHMLILEGKQGIGKSRALRILGGPFYLEYSEGIKSGSGQKDMVSNIVGKVIVELSELATMRRSDIESLKAILTTSVDGARLSYERYSKNYPRTCVFAGTTNEVAQEYIADQTGARRFWPIHCAEVKPVRSDLLAEDVEMLWAEAVEAFEEGEDWWTVPEELVAEEQSHRQTHISSTEPWHERILSAMTESESHVDAFVLHDEFNNGTPTGEYVLRTTINQILQFIFGIEASRMSFMDVVRVRKVLTDIGFKKVRVRTPKGTADTKRGNAYDLTRKTLPHMWPAILGAARAVKFRKSTTSADKGD